MLEKIGLPAKPSLRGNNWVIDATNCQGCSSQFTFINRKHHCRRCGGLFCNSCTQQRMVLRGQGDSPVRICEPCKKLEEAARFEMRYGHKNRGGRGSLKPMKYEDEILDEILGTDVNESSSLGLRYNTNKVSSIKRASSSSSWSNVQETTENDREGEIHRSPSVDGQKNVQREIGSASLEELRQQALEEKKKYKILKGEGKPEEALRAFKRGKELERQADALEISIRKTRKRAFASGNVALIQNTDGNKESVRKNKASSVVGKDKDDFASELRELGWSDIGLHDEGRKPASLSLEGELSSLLGEVPQRSNKGMGTHGLDNTQVVALKKRALMLKREGKLAEAKEELKKAKVLEKQLEEQELLAGAEEPDDELSALIHSMDDDRKDKSSIEYEMECDFDFDPLVGIGDDLGTDGNFEVTDEDMVDPEMAAALKSLGWTEDPSDSENDLSTSAPLDNKAILTEIQYLKREAINQKRAGNIAEAVAQLKKAKLLEKDCESTNSETADSSPKSVKVADKEFVATEEMDSKGAPKSRLMIQKELLAFKKKALALKREGRLDEAEEELKKGRVLEHQLEEMDSASKLKSAEVTVGSKNRMYERPDASGDLLVGEEVDVTDQEMHDAGYLSVLRTLGWTDEDRKLVDSSSKCSKQSDNYSGQTTEASQSQGAPTVPALKSRSKAEMQRELLGLKRKALALRRQGNTDEAEEALKTAKSLEAQMAEMDVLKNFRTDSNQMKDKLINPASESAINESDEGDIMKDMQDPALLSMLKNLGWKDEDLEPVTLQEKASKQDVGDSMHSAGTALVPKSKREIQKELLGLKREALALRRKGENEKAEELLKMAKVLEAQMAELEAPEKELRVDASRNEKSGYSESFISHAKHANINDEVGLKKGSAPATNPTDESTESHTANFPLRSSDTLTLSISQPIGNNHSLLGEQNPLNEMAHPGNVGTTEAARVAPPSVQSVMDLLTGNELTTIPAGIPEDRKNFGSGDSSLAESPNKELESKDGLTSEKGKVVDMDDKRNEDGVNSVQRFTSQKNQDLLRQEVLAHKRKALILKREGKLSEAREELRQAKLLERNLEEARLQQNPSPSDVSMSVSDGPSSGHKENSASNLASKPLSGRDRFKLQQESLSHKRQALKLRREGRVQEAEAEFELAKALEAQLDELSAHDSSKSTACGPEAVDDVVVEDLLDPQLLSALKAIGLDGADIVSKSPEKAETLKQYPVKGETLKQYPVKDENSSQERIQLEERIKAEKTKALNLKRAGKQAEALDALRRAKLFEKKLNSLASN